MKIFFRLMWVTAEKEIRKAFKVSGSGVLFSDYLKRIHSFHPCEVKGIPQQMPRKGEARYWLCDNGKGAEPLSSTGAADKLQKLQNAGVKELHVLIGGPDGHKNPDSSWKPDLRWSFGPMTLPHELAAIVAAEQIYRAFTILHHHPYHTGHL